MSIWDTRSRKRARQPRCTTDAMTDPVRMGASAWWVGSYLSDDEQQQVLEALDLWTRDRAVRHWWLETAEDRALEVYLICVSGARPMMARELCSFRQTRKAFEITLDVGLVRGPRNDIEQQTWNAATGAAVVFASTRGLATPPIVTFTPRWWDGRAAELRQRPPWERLSDAQMHGFLTDVDRYLLSGGAIERLCRFLAISEDQLEQWRQQASRTQDQHRGVESAA